jgi:hypothetical protein
VKKSRWPAWRTALAALLVVGLLVGGVGMFWSVVHASRNPSGPFVIVETR